MNLLTLIREEAIVANVKVGNAAWDLLVEAMRDAAKDGEYCVKVDVLDQDRKEVDAAIRALKLIGFYASFENEGRRAVEISWMPQ